MASLSLPFLNFFPPGMNKKQSTKGDEDKRAVYIRIRNRAHAQTCVRHGERKYSICMPNGAETRTGKQMKINFVATYILPACAQARVCDDRSYA